eukprot:8049834-Alexandrium_andersonii.AAC.1
MRPYAKSPDSGNIECVPLPGPKRTASHASHALCQGVRDCHGLQDGIDREQPSGPHATHNLDWQFRAKPGGRCAYVQHTRVFASLAGYLDASCDKARRHRPCRNRLGILNNTPVAILKRKHID